MIKSIKLFLYTLGRLTGSLIQVTKAFEDFNNALEKIDEMMMYQRINKWEGNWILSIPDYY